MWPSRPRAGRCPPALGGCSARADELAIVLRTDDLEEGLVDLAVVDRHVLLEAEPDDLLAIHAVLLRELLGRQVIRHPFYLPAEGGSAGAAGRAENVEGPPCERVMG